MYVRDLPGEQKSLTANERASVLTGIEALSCLSGTSAVLLPFDKRADVLNQHGYSHRVEPAFGDDDVGILFRRLDELLVHGFHGRRVLRNDRLHRTSAVADVAQDAPGQPDVGIGIDEDLDVHQVAQLLVLEDQNAVDDDHFRRFDIHGLGHPVVVDERIDRMFDRHVLLQRLDVFDKHLRVECLRVVVIEFRTLLVGELRVGLVVVVVAERHHVVALEGFLQPLDERRFSRAGSSGHSDYRNFHEVSSLLLFFKSKGSPFRAILAQAVYASILA